eukprot:Clim_evm122s149 gene=Clim_evmTU122s149
MAGTLQDIPNKCRYAGCNEMPRSTRAWYCDLHQEEARRERQRRHYYRHQDQEIERAREKRKRKAAGQSKKAKDPPRICKYDGCHNLVKRSPQAQYCDTCKVTAEREKNRRSYYRHQEKQIMRSRRNRKNKSDSNSRSESDSYDTGYGMAQAANMNTVYTPRSSYLDSPRMGYNGYTNQYGVYGTAATPGSHDEFYGQQTHSGQNSPYPYSPRPMDSNQGTPVRTAGPSQQRPSHLSHPGEVKNEQHNNSGSEGGMLDYLAHTATQILGNIKTTEATETSRASSPAVTGPVPSPDHSPRRYANSPAAATHTQQHCGYTPATQTAYGPTGQLAPPQYPPYYHAG